MKRLATLLLLATLTPPLVLAASGSDAGEIACYPTYGYQDGERWTIPVRVWVHDRPAALNNLMATLTHWRDADDRWFRPRIQDFLADSRSRKAVSVRFDQDPTRREYRIEDPSGRAPRSDRDGIIEGQVRIAPEQPWAPLPDSASGPVWLTYQGTAPGFAGQGKVQLIGPVGLSVVSDIDDTIKVTEIPAGGRTVVENTFFRAFQAAPGMAAMYRDLQAQGAVFHYVSGAPWQLYAPLAEFLFGPAAGFPPGSIAMKNVWLHPLSLRTWEGLLRLIRPADQTRGQKLAQIGAILNAFPARRFILIGDSGEQDPEVYREIARRFPRQVQEIRIRDLVADRERRPARLEGMTVIPADTILPRPDD